MELADERSLVPQNRSLKTQNQLKTQLCEGFCTCKRPRIQKSWTKNTLGVNIGSQSTYRHRTAGCPLFREEDSITKFLFDMSLISRLVKTSARFSLSLQYGAGGVSVSPNLTLRGLKCCNAPIFALLRTLNEPRCSTLERDSRMNEVLPRIKLLVQKGEVSPYDVDEDGRTVFGVRHSSAGLKGSAKFLQAFFS